MNQRPREANYRGRDWGRVSWLPLGGGIKIELIGGLGAERTGIGGSGRGCRWGLERAN